MGYLKIKTMSQPNGSWWMQIFEWIKENTIIFVVFGLSWKGLDKGFKYLSEGRDERITLLIEQKLNSKVTPQIEKLSDSIDELKDAIMAIALNKTR